MSAIKGFHAALHAREAAAVMGAARSRLRRRRAARGLRVGHRRRVGSGDPDRSAGLLPVVGAAGQADPGRLRRRSGLRRAERGDRQARAGTEVRRVDAGSLRAVLRVFYDFLRDVGTGPMVNPFPLSRDRRGGRAHAHHNPMEPFRNERVGLYRPRVAQRIPRAIPDELFNRVFAELGSHRDRALIALWVSTGARASELLGCDAAMSMPASS